MLVTQGGALSLIKGHYKYISPREGPARSDPKLTNIELGNSPEPMLFNLQEDIGEQHNLAGKMPSLVKELAADLEKIRKQ